MGNRVEKLIFPSSSALHLLVFSCVFRNGLDASGCAVGLPPEPCYEPQCASESGNQTHTRRALACARTPTADLSDGLVTRLNGAMKQ